MIASKDNSIYREEATILTSGENPFEYYQDNAVIKLPQLTVVAGTTLTTLATTEPVTQGQALMLVTTNEEGGVEVVAGAVTGTNPYLTDISSGTHSVAPYNAFTDNSGSLVVETGLEDVPSYGADNSGRILWEEKTLTKVSATAEQFVGITDQEGIFAVGDTVNIDGSDVVLTSVAQNSATRGFPSDDGVSGILGYYDEQLTGTGSWSPPADCNLIKVLCIGGGGAGGSSGTNSGGGGSGYQQVMELSVSPSDSFAFEVGGPGGHSSFDGVAAGAGAGGGVGSCPADGGSGTVGSGGGGGAPGGNGGGCSGSADPDVTAPAGHGGGTMSSTEGFAGAVGTGGAGSAAGYGFYGGCGGGGASILGDGGGAGGGAGGVGAGGGSQGTGGDGAVVIKHGNVKIQYTLGFAPIVGEPNVVKVAKRAVASARASWTFDKDTATKTIIYNEENKLGKAFQRQIKANTGVEVVEPLTSNMKQGA